MSPRAAALTADVQQDEPSKKQTDQHVNGLEDYWSPKDFRGSKEKKEKKLKDVKKSKTEIEEFWSNPQNSLVEDGIVGKQKEKFHNKKFDLKKNNKLELSKNDEKHSKSVTTPSVTNVDDDGEVYFGFHKT